jgi:hypothetical protein
MRISTALDDLPRDVRYSMNLLNPSAEGFSEHKAFVFGDTGFKAQRQWH